MSRNRHRDMVWNNDILNKYDLGTTGSPFEKNDKVVSIPDILYQNEF